MNMGFDLGCPLIRAHGLKLRNQIIRIKIEKEIGLQEKNENVISTSISDYTVFLGVETSEVKKQKASLKN